MREDRPTRGPRPVNWRACLLLAGWLAPLALWVAALAVLKFNTGLAAKAVLVWTAALALCAHAVQRWRRVRPGRLP